MVDIICKGVSPITMITCRRMTIMLLFRRSGVLELGACHMESECIRLDEYGVITVTGWTHMGVTALKGEYDYYQGRLLDGYME